MEVTRQKVDGDFRIRQLKAQQLLRGDLEGKDLEEYVEKQVMLTRLEKAQASGAKVLYPAYRSSMGQTAMVEFPGGYIAEIHDGQQ